MQPGDLGVVMRRPEDDVRQQQQLERQHIGHGKRAQHQGEVDQVGAAHAASSHGISMSFRYNWLAGAVASPTAECSQDNRWRLLCQQFGSSQT